MKDFWRGLFAHQQHAILEMERRECTRQIHLRSSIIETNVGMYADISGYGKTRVIVGLVWRDRMAFDMNTPYIHHVVTQVHGNGNIIKKTLSEYQRLNTTLILASKNILQQWVTELSLTPLKVLTITRRRVCEHIDPHAYDVVLCSPSLLNDVVGRFPNYAWKRFVFDEPTTTRVPAMRSIVAQHHWLVTATPEALLYTSRNQLTYLGALFSSGMEYNVFRQCIFKNDDDVVRSSVDLPEVHHAHHSCRMTAFTVLKDILPRNIHELISAGDIQRVIEMFGGQTTHNLFELIENEKKELLGEASSKIARYTRLDDPQRLEKWQQRRDILQQEIDNLSQRLETVCTSEACCICRHHLENPVFSRCCYNTFCGSCILHWISTQNSCPLCRQNMTCADMLYIRSDHHAPSSTSSPSTLRLDDVRTKVQTIERLVTDKPHGRFLIFSSHDKTFTDLQRIFPTILRLHGRCEQRQRSLDMFKTHAGSILFLHSIDDGAGINLPEATDIILFHDMSESIETQVIGRCQRIGRQTPLNVHHFHDMGA